MSEEPFSFGAGWTVDPSHLTLDFVRASGPGGQNVNKVSTAVQLRFDLAAADYLPDDLRERAARLAGSRLTKDGVIVLSADRFRTQEANRRDALERLTELLAAAAERPKPRRPTRPGAAARRRRVEGKARRGAVKAMRGRPTLD